MTPSIHWALLGPEVIVTTTLVVVFVADLFLSEYRRRWLTPISVFGLLIAFVAVFVIGGSNNDQSMLNGSFVVDSFALVGKGIFLACAAAALGLGVGRAWKGEYLLMVLSSVLGMLLVVSARDLVLFFVAFELFAIPGYLLTGWRKTSRLGHEGLLKYYLLGVLATAVMLYGISLLFGVAGSSSFAAVDFALRTGGAEVALARIAVLFVLIGLAFKVSAVPFHFWAPDAYQSAPVPVAAFLSVVTKAAGVFSFLALCAFAFPSASAVWAPLVLILSIVSMTVGNIAALRQNDLVRLLAYSSIAQAGYLLMPLAVAIEYGGSGDDTFRHTVEYLVIYAVTNLAAFAAIIAIVLRRGDSSYESARGLFVTSPLLAIAFSASLFSLAGIPPFGGWFAKLVVFKAAIDAGSDVAIALVVIAAVNTAIGLVYYANVIRQLWLPQKRTSSIEAETVRYPQGLVVTIGVLTFGVIVTGVLPGLVTRVGEWVVAAG